MLRWLRSTLRGETSVAGLDASRRAGGLAYSLIEEVDELDGSGRGPQLFKLCAWNAFALETIGETLIECDARDDPPTSGYVPRSTLRYATACIDSVPGWIRRARIVQGDPLAHLGVELPAHLPRWVHDEPTTRSELHGLRTAYEALQPRVESAAGPGNLPTHVRRLLAEMSDCLDYVDAVNRPRLGPADRGAVRERLLEALEKAFRLGQLLAFPTLAEQTWLDIAPGWLVLDSRGTRVGFVQRIRGDRASGEFEGLVVDTGVAGVDVHVAPDALASVGFAEVTLRMEREQLGLA